MAWWRRSSRHLGSEADRATFRTLHTASLAAPALRAGLTETSAQRSAKHLRTLLGSAAVALTDATDLLGWEGLGLHHKSDAMALAQDTFATGTSRVTARGEVQCPETCEIKVAVIAPLVVEERIVGTLQAYVSAANASLVRACDEVARWTSSQLELAELDQSRARLMEAEVRALRAQISPHFIYNSLGAIASFVRTDPDRARELLLEFADFTRYSFRRHGEFTTLSEELRSIERYLLLEQARFGDRLAVTLQIAPEVLPVSVPFLCIQPLVENAVQHGLAEGSGHIRITARNAGHEAIIEVEDDGVGEDPDKVRRALAGDPSDSSDSSDTGEGPPGSVGLSNVDARLRATFGNDYGLVVETAPGAGTRVILRVPMFAPAVHP